MIDTERKRE